MLIGMTSKYKLRDIIPGTLAAIVVLNGIAVFAGGIISVFVPGWLIKFIASAAFFYFGITAILKNEEDDEEAESGKFKFAVAAVFCTFFIAELGDKTQLTAITFGANGGIGRAFVIWAACVVGFFAADMIGMLAGLFLKKKMPEGFLNAVSFVLFSFFGFTTLWEGLGILQDSLAAGPDGNGVHKKLIFGLASVIFAFLSIAALVKKLKNRKKKTDILEFKYQVEFRFLIHLLKNFKSRKRFSGKIEHSLIFPVVLNILCRNPVAAPVKNSAAAGF